MNLSDGLSGVEKYVTTSETFSRLKGNEPLKILLLLLAIDPSIGGMVIMGRTGTGKSCFLEAFKDLQIPLHREDKNFAPIIDIPSNISFDALIDTLNLQLKFREGIFSKVHNGFLIIDDFHLLSESIANTIINVWKTKENIVHRSNLSINQSSNFCLLISINSSFHEISTAVLDKFAFVYEMKDFNTLQERLDIVNMNIEPMKDPNLYKEKNNLYNSINQARNMLSEVNLPISNIQYISTICQQSEIQGHRADIALARGAIALACLLNRNEVAREDIDFLVPYVLSHRLPERKESFENDIININKGVSHDLREKKDPNFSSSPMRAESPKRIRIILEWFASIFGICMTALFSSIIITQIITRPDLLISLFSALSLWGLGTFLLLIYLKKRRKLMKEYKVKEDENVEQKPDLTSFSHVKHFQIIKSVKEEKKPSKKEVILDLDEDRSRKGKLLRFVGLKRRQGLISFTEKQRLYASLFGVIVLIISFFIFSYFISILPVEFWIQLIIFLVSLFTIGYIIQSLRKNWRVHRAADIGASEGESSRKLDDKGIGTHISPIERLDNESLNPQEDYGTNLLNRLAELDLLPKKNFQGVELIVPPNNTSLRSVRIIADALPTLKTRIDSRKRSKMGKRAISVTSLQSGRVIGSHPFIHYPKNIHLLATLRNTIMRQYRERASCSTNRFIIKLEDIQEKTFCTRVSATIIFVLDLSESIVSTINAVSSSVNWLSRQAYLYRDRVGIVVLQGTQGVIIQPPTSNLNLVKRKLKNLKASGATPLAGGLQKAVELIKLDLIRNKNESIPMIILITDGATNIPLLKDPWTGVTRNTPLKELKDRAYSMAILDCLAIAHQIKKSKISLIIFNTNRRGELIFRKIPRTQQESIIDFLNQLIVESTLFRGRRHMDLWSYTLLRAMQEITRGFLYHLTRIESDYNLETLRIARAEILANITN